MRLLILFSMLTIMWMALVDDISLKGLAMGVALSALIILSMRRMVAHRTFVRQPVTIGSFLQIGRYFIHTGAEFFRANLKVALMVLRPKLHLRPAILAIPTETQGDLEATALANSISLLPGTLSLDFSGDDHILYVHFLDLDRPIDEARQSIKKHERYVIRAL